MSLQRPRFKPHLRVEVVPGEGAFVLSESRRTLLRGRLYEEVVPRIGEGRSADDVCAMVDGRASPAEVYFVFDQLERRGYLCEEAPALSPGEAALWSSQQVDPAEAARRLAAATVSVVGLGVDPAPFAALLESIGIRTADEGGSFRVVLVDDYARGDLESLNAELLRGEVPWMLARPVGREVWFGPIFRPGRTGCWACLADRLGANRPVESYLESKDGRAPSAPVPGFSAATLQAALGLAAHAIASFLARGESPELEGKVQTLDLAAWKAREHVLVQLPYCPACGDRSRGADATPRRLALSARPKSFTADGGHRGIPPEETLARYERHVSPITGAVSMLERVAPAGNGTMHVYLAGQNMARRHHSLEHLRGDLRSMSAGKGMTDAQAKASGLCEGLERHSGVFRGDEPRRRATLRELGGAVVAPPDCLLFSDRQYRDRDAWNAHASKYQFVPSPFDPARAIEWTPAWSLTHDEPRYLATAFCYYNYPHRDGPPFCVACSNGNAAGNTIEEAILQGFLELVERDSVALWWYNRVRRPAVDLASFGEEYLYRHADFLRGRDRAMWAIDLTSDLGIPVFAAITRSLAGGEERILLGFGAHLDARIALLRAVTEMNQMLSSLYRDPAAPEREIPEHLSDPDTVEWLRTATVANQPYLVSDPETPPRLAEDFPAWSADDIAEDVRTCRASVERRGMEVIVLDQTRPEIGLPVVKVVVPGLRHFWARFAPGRLYDVPVELGWLPRPTPEEGLNPIPMFL